MLVVVGDPDVLGLDPLWRSFLNYIHISGGWKGTRISWDPKEGVDRAPPNGGSYDARLRSEMESEMDELVSRTRAIILDQCALDQEEDEDADVRAVEATADRPWRQDD